MHKDGYYSSGEFARKAHVSVRTIRYYDQQNILKPTLLDDSGARFYSDSDFTRLQQVLLLKYIGFSLDEIRNMTIGDSDYHILLNSLQMQQKLIRDRIAQMQLVDKAITNTTDAIIKNKSVDWSSMLDLIHLTNMESSLKNQYLNASNISARINLHTLYSTNKEGWFPWVFHETLSAVFNQATPDSSQPVSVLELGCGDGSLWVQNFDSIPDNLSITLSDISNGMLRDARRSIETRKASIYESAYLKAISPKTACKIRYKAFDCARIPYEADTFDVILANHVLFYCDNLDDVLAEIRRVLKPDGIFLCSTYSSKHMKEINELVSKFDERIVLSSNKLYEKFGKENGGSILGRFFDSIEWKSYDDKLVIDRPEPVIDYILSCHGNQNQYLLNRYADFKEFVTEQIRRSNGSIHITKDAGLFVCK